MVNGINNEIKDLLDFKFFEYNKKSFIEFDPISIPYRFSNKEDIEIISFLISTISWGNRKSIINSGEKLISILGNSPYDFIMNFKENKMTKFSFVHRTFNSVDLLFFFKSLNNIYKNHNGLENIFSKFLDEDFVFKNILNFRKVFFSIDHPKRSEKHVSNPIKNSACKRINMFLRWMVRNDKNVDFGIWSKLKPSMLSCPLDVHTANTARKLGLIKRKQNDFKTLKELDKSLRILDKKDPVKYDYALFGLGAFEGF
ncbi:MAG: TIGR02757 family protein [Cryomorphaceae bacterium MED-G14]|nr:MAG: TIGR02757 family protein [Cryomorphaceae bacterium MED-G14]|tara:strand:+ start:6467 stop:7234 length:768 start_codon:yes stop_codon:yes gene_type:complete